MYCTFTFTFTFYKQNVKLRMNYESVIMLVLSVTPSCDVVNKIRKSTAFPAITSTGNPSTRMSSVSTIFQTPEWCNEASSISRTQQYQAPTYKMQTLSSRDLYTPVTSLDRHDVKTTLIMTIINLKTVKRSFVNVAGKIQHCNTDGSIDVSWLHHQLMKFQ